jgi:hypothetical protein
MSRPSHDLEQLAEACWHHLGEEETVLTETLQLVEQTRQALRQRDVEAMLAKVPQLEQNQQHRRTIQQERLVLQKRIGGQLDIPPEQVTMSTLLPRIPSKWRDPFHDRRRHLQELARNIDNLNRANLALVASFGEILSRVLFDLTGQVTARCYGPSGRLNETDSTLMFERDY